MLYRADKLQLAEVPGILIMLYRADKLQLAEVPGILCQPQKA